ncbi:ABC transporter ATP-binding protein [Pararhodobacter aggregans]|uniref:ABC transporter ATP-binding protein n=1 Tax=Pararhodobacter aggregans TaxID=404875 RepID=A0A2T7UP91_9RHOB|nr:ABC transporter ATP-binding protein [Pararhodobacter aggregans]PTX01131.1 peptide/nickel transport system ATP-binding protein/oligopeptide transport system ATP-binding protein [Pararhodobacter aggregans]PVE46523.1 ABC transporter ATP-binding protein [Pararhodobacter aggregans]
MTALLDIRDLHLSMHSFEGAAKVLSGVSLSVEKRQIWGLVGETGCGKSLTGLSVSRLVRTPPAEYTGGQILMDGTDVLGLSEPQMRALRGRRVGMIFQDPTTNLNPAFRIGTQLIDVALAAAKHDPAILGLEPGAGRRARKAAARKLAIAMLTEVGIPAAESRLDDYPHQFSGGMRQRVLIAMALIGRPGLLIADEPTTALDVSVQAQILTLLKQMVATHDMGVVLITHNLGVVAQTCTHVAVMYAGTIVEKGPIEAVLADPAHPYTQALLRAIPDRSVKRGQLQGLAGAVPNLIHPPPGCRFAPRCALARPSCLEGPPPVHTRAPGHAVACPVVEEVQHA